MDIQFNQTISISEEIIKSIVTKTFENYFAPKEFGSSGGPGFFDIQNHVVMLLKTEYRTQINALMKTTIEKLLQPTIEEVVEKHLRTVLDKRLKAIRAELKDQTHEN